jgi:2'-5' RNA ligase
MPRLFTALEIPSLVAQSLSMMRGGLPGARWIDAENYHLTLRFIGDIDDALAHEIAGMLGRVRRTSFQMRLDGLTSFGGRKPRALVAAATPIAPLMELQADHERLLQRLGLEPEGRKYTPHVTLARLRDSSSHQVAEYLSARGHYRSASFEVSRFVLFSSRSSVGGGPYVVEADYPLERSASAVAGGATPGERSERWGRSGDVHPHPDFASLAGPPSAGEGE